MSTIHQSSNTFIVPYKGITPIIDPTVFLAPGATIVGDTTIGHESSIWFQAVVRGDVNKITIGSQTNIQDHVVIHGTYEKHSTFIGHNVSIGHSTILHGCTIHDSCLVGMNVTVMDGVEIGEECMIGAGSLLTSFTKIPKRSLAFGRPAKVIRPLTDEEVEELYNSAKRYLMYTKGYDFRI
jgi:carbonic anhydrase/acetyltransferase-like protein (isoleucine patch superfamily)